MSRLGLVAVNSDDPIPQLLWGHMELVQFCIARTQRIPARVTATGGLGRSMRSVVAWIMFDGLERKLRRELADHDDAFRVVQANLDLFERLTLAKHEQGDSVPHPQAGPLVDLVVIVGEDIDSTGERLHDPVAIAIWSTPSGCFGSADHSNSPIVR